MPANYNQFRPSRGYRKRPNTFLYLFEIELPKADKEQWPPELSQWAYGFKADTLGDAREMVRRMWNIGLLYNPRFELPFWAMWLYKWHRCGVQPVMRYYTLLGAAGPFFRIDKDFPPELELAPEDRPVPGLETASAYVERLQRGTWGEDSDD